MRSFAIIATIFAAAVGTASGEKIVAYHRIQAALTSLDSV